MGAKSVSHNRCGIEPVCCIYSQVGRKAYDVLSAEALAAAKVDFVTLLKKRERLGCQEEAATACVL